MQSVAEEIYLTFYIKHKFKPSDFKWFSDFARKATVAERETESEDLQQQVQRSRRENNSKGLSLHERFPSVTSQSLLRSAALNRAFVQLTGQHISSSYRCLVLRLGNQSTVLICWGLHRDLCLLEAASCALTPKMQLTEPILHSPLTPLALLPPLPLLLVPTVAVIRMQGPSQGPHTE